jgi:hypothetical protein
MGSALSASKRRISLAAGFGLTVAIAFVYLIFLRLGLSDSGSCHLSCFQGLLEPAGLGQES